MVELLKLGRMPWFIICCCIMLSMAGIFTGCSNMNDRTGNWSATEVGRRIQETIAFDHMKEGDLAKLQKLYRIPAEQVEDFVLYTSSSNVKAEEWTVMQFSDAADADAAIAKLNERIKEQEAKFRDYRPDEYKLVKNHVLKAKDRFLLFAVSAEADLIERTFDEVVR
ncbi:hypothetical protein PAEVO_15420 [Paenibacillus sp. GM2FR]|jgi:hypothetical protein|uniref:DUF4358 domain-containing protein n=2 Tax=Paenibacillus TaxID=44249 RepID=UPI000CACEF2C|nr:DUF4358 domain-containing protein [Paenibacillus lautus]MEC0258703.1 DUF4358 domain-containing protein [Paenibacillus lautus]PJN54821.1 hypothetical protein PAEVO_15420 [Paenibacillus sp. GM2FR]